MELFVNFLAYLLALAYIVVITLYTESDDYAVGFIATFFFISIILYFAPSYMVKLKKAEIVRRARDESLKAQHKEHIHHLHHTDLAHSAESSHDKKSITNANDTSIVTNSTTSNNMYSSDDVMTNEAPVALTLPTQSSTISSTPVTTTQFCISCQVNAVHSF